MNSDGGQEDADIIDSGLCSWTVDIRTQMTEVDLRVVLMDQVLEMIFMVLLLIIKVVEKHLKGGD